jgi:hypothetical protein
VTPVRFVDETPFGFGWIAPEPAFMERASHAILVADRVWVIDPVEGDGVIERIVRLGQPAGILVLIDRHARDSAAIAERLAVPRYVVPDEPDATQFELVPLGRKERALWVPEHATLVVSEGLGTPPYYCAPAERVGIHPFRRLFPPTELRAFEPEHLLFSHGEGVHGAEATAALHDTLAHARRRAPAWLRARLSRRGR